MKAMKAFFQRNGPKFATNSIRPIPIWHLLRLEGLGLGQSLHEPACKRSLQAWHANITTDDFQPFQLHCQLWDVNVHGANVQHFFTIERLLDLGKIILVLISFTTTKKLAQVG